MLKKLLSNSNGKSGLRLSLNKNSSSSIIILSNGIKNNTNIYGITCMNISKKYYSTSNYVRSSSNPSDPSSESTSIKAESASSSIPPVDLNNVEASAAIVNNGDVITDLIAPQLGYTPSHICMSLIENVHIIGDVPYWVAIAGLTVALRVFLLPVAIKTVQNSARMAALRPDMQVLQDAFTKNPNQNDNAVRLKFQTEMKGLFKKHKVD